MRDRVHDRFEEELRQRGANFEWDAESDRYVLEVGGDTLRVSLDNLRRDLARDGDESRIADFANTVFASIRNRRQAPSAEHLYWCLEPNDYAEPPSFRRPISRRIDRVLVHLTADARLISWAHADMLHLLSLTEAAAEARGFANLAGQLEIAKLTVENVDGVRLGFLTTGIPFKTALLLAPNLQEVVGSELGWPLLAVAPDRDFLYLWSARQQDFLGRLGGIVVREFKQASYPLSTEVFEVSDAGIRAIGAFPVDG